MPIHKRKHTDMQNPVLVNVYRGQAVESWHRGSVVVCDAQGKTVLALGDTDKPVFPRSAVKAFQALPLLESGAADRFGLSSAQIALACASHSGEPEHAQTASDVLALAGRTDDTLECGAHWPMGETYGRALAAKGFSPSALHNNCSGKHAGFICLACAMDVDTKGYVQAGHIVQKEVKAAIEGMTGAALSQDTCGTDGCSIPTYAVPLKALAAGFARFGTGEGLAPERAKAAMRIRASVAANSFMVAGTGRFDTLVMTAFGARVFCKVGAEGVYCASLPELGLGVAIKCDDGSARAAEVMMAAVIARLLPLSEAEKTSLDRHLKPVLTNWNGIRVGSLEPAGALA